MEQPLPGGLEAEAGELRHAEILLVERRVDLLHDLLEAVGAHHVAVLLHATDRLGHELVRIPLAGARLVARLHEAREGVVRVVLVAVLHEQVARRLADADADDVLAVLLELDDEAREVGVAREQDEGADLGTREDELDRIDREADVGRVLLGRAVGRRHDHVDRRLGERHDVLRVATPVGVGALDVDLAGDDRAAEQVAELRLQVGADPHRDVVEIDEEGGVGRVHVDAGAHGLRAPMEGGHRSARGTRACGMVGTRMHRVLACIAGELSPVATRRKARERIRHRVRGGERAQPLIWANVSPEDATGADAKPAAGALVAPMVRAVRRRIIEALSASRPQT